MDVQPARPLSNYQGVMNCMIGNIVDKKNPPLCHNKAVFKRKSPNKKWNLYYCNEHGNALR